MNLIREYLGSVAGVQIFAIVSLFIFLMTFIFLLFQTFSIAKDRVKEYSKFPLEEDNGASKQD
jgi:hypothetical protein